MEELSGLLSIGKDYEEQKRMQNYGDVLNNAVNMTREELLHVMERVLGVRELAWSSPWQRQNLNVSLEQKAR